MSPSFVIIFSDNDLREVLKEFEGSVKFCAKGIINLRYAEDKHMYICSSKEKLMDVLKRRNTARENKNLLNAKKTKTNGSRQRQNNSSDTDG